MKLTILVFVIGITLATAANLDRIQVEIDFDLNDEDDTQLMGNIFSIFISIFVPRNFL